MHVLILVLMLSLMAYDASGLARGPVLDGWRMPAAVLGTHAALIACTGWACRRTLAALRRDGSRTGPRLLRLDRVLGGIRYAAAAVFLVQVYGLGWLQWVRETVGDWVLLDELAAAAPVLVTLTSGWFWYYAVDRRLRGGGGSRLGYVTSQVRHHVLLVLAPLAVVMAWMQALDRWVAPHPRWGALEQPLMFAGFTTIFLFAPVMIRYLWDTVPLPEGELRRSLMEMCRRHGVRIRQLLLWRTWGGMINGAVMGLIGPLRYILLTDGLLDRMTPVEVEAVMAHELGHIRRRHIVWLVVCAVAVIYGLEAAMYGGLEAIDGLSGGRVSGSPLRTATEVAGLAAAVMAWVMIFGWVSRRFERQADVFAVRHLSARYPSLDPPGRIDPAAVDVYCQTLTRVAALNSTPPDRRSWRHGSIQWRCDYLRSQAGRPSDRCPIDALVRRICLLAATLLTALLVYDGVLGPWVTG